MGPLTTPEKGVEGHCVDPWTPTSNLKILISAASPDIRNREIERSLEEAEVYCREDAEEPEEAERMTSRKDKSLGLLCRKFLERFPNFPDKDKDYDICLDDVASELSVERRRIYDIMNVLESLHMVSRSAKNRYMWHGRTNLSQTLCVLQKAGQEQGYSRRMQQLRLGGPHQQPEEEEEENQQPQQNRELCFVELPGVECKLASVNSRKDKSLRVMSQKFVMLFLVACPRVVSLDIAAQILIGEDHGEAQDKNKFKTKVRRLYDIANVLRSLKLIEKVHVTEERGRKPAFQWVGPEKFQQVQGVEETRNTTAASCGSSKENCSKKLFSDKRSFTRHPSLIKLARSIQEDRRRVSSAPSSPAKATAGDSLMDFPNKMAELAAICKLQLDHESSGSKGSETSRPSLPRTPVTPLTPVLLPRQQQDSGGGAYVVYAPPCVRPQPTSLAVRSMTFDSPTGVKRPGAEGQTEASPRKRRRECKDASPKLGEILQNRLKSRSLYSSRPPLRALHLDPEFQSSTNLSSRHSPASAAAANHRAGRSTVDKEESEGSTPVRAVPLTPTAVHTETLVPAGYLIPLPQSALAFKDLHSSTDAQPVPTVLFHTPTAGSISMMHQERTPTHMSRASPLSPFSTPRTQSPSPAILNFTLQNLGLISAHSPVPVPVPVQGRAGVGCSPQAAVSLPHRGGMLFLRPVSPLQLHSTNGGHMALFSLQQPGPLTPTSSPGFFHTPVSMTTLSSTSSVANGNGSTFVAQRKLDVGSEDS
ncbi:unnamed protein product [Knipowitschia caucasica]|uniref:Transcription factor E2F8 n=1 Tax=Knipowitschia caucasica TaxID=637954 RepID=A0AAV2LV52_KNICA